ncbi:hypothetical protein NRB56_22380 [Nocardia sp. RB56]|uniref:Uncharacterized protein n=1 Tax=Nocardia aurantia TaxID=2585199 RepID=A0A7K0DLY7_9NOCA|nr:hypothetical protein [Nocardia aurantia]
MHEGARVYEVPGGWERYDPDEYVDLTRRCWDVDPEDQPLPQRHRWCRCHRIPEPLVPITESDDFSRDPETMVKVRDALQAAQW